MKNIAFTMREVSTVGYKETRDAISQDWLNYSAKLNSIPFLIPNIEENLEHYVDQICPHLIILTGGNNIGDSAKRDRTEMRLIQIAINNEIPILGVCRGLQVINCFFGGKFSKIDNHVNKEHKIYISDKFKRFYGSEVIVNSYHNFGIKRSDVGVNLDILASDRDGMIEGLVHKSHAIIGIMWHPERSNNNNQDKNLIKEMLNMLNTKNIQY